MVIKVSIALPIFFMAHKVHLWKRTNELHGDAACNPLLLPTPGYRKIIKRHRDLGQPGFSRRVY